jgi:hypothetical protein
VSEHVARKNRARKARILALHRAYRRLPGQCGFCAYCGERCSGWDHVPALSEVEARGRSFFEDAGITLWLIQACRDCNVTLGSLPLYTINQRRKHISLRLQSRHSKLLLMPRWDEEELEALGRGLRKYVEESNLAADHLKRRIAYAELWT